ncbi:phosphatidylserine decarboxylase [Chitinophaga filiformis]|uniref:phosphatidylserine decarboxylase n=1 Tax=Chitinophaga filiformis TaxID=104663 RepID=UPI001F3ABD90|nr:phosphatidylserine decarboxylase [Chitinophaga filiformis]MCF6405507.1 phosphatidylserine decarboxylase [Chitinophaga filiformis]
MITLTSSSTDVIQNLAKQIDQDPFFADALTASLVAANARAKTSLDPELYAALNDLYSSYGWPVMPADYLVYLTNFAEVIPSENTNPKYDPWQNTSSQNGYSQEIYDRLCHFYWLVDQPLDGKTLQDYRSAINDFSFADWLVEYANAWGSFLNTPESLTPETLASFKNDPEYNLQDYSDDEPNWTSFNTFFYRQLNSLQPDGSPMRPVANPFDNTIISSPADCTFKAHYKIDGNGNVLDVDGNRTNVTLKKTHSIGNISDLLGPDASQYASNFYNGTFVHYFLSPFDYHRYHAPVNGKVLYLGAVPGKVYLNVNISGGQFDAPDGAEDGYEFSQARGILVLETGDDRVGKVVVAPIGMAQVSSVNMYSDDLEGRPVQKGQEFGYFAFGGSDIIMLFEQPLSALKFVTHVANAEEPASYHPPAPFHFRYGQASVIICNQA